MRIIFSRKGFDSGSGKCPSPIIDGKPVSLPIPTSRRSEISYEAIGLGDTVEKVTKGRIQRIHLCHEDPVFFDGRCAFGQTGGAQSHLAKHGVGIGDVFVFFGLFRDELTGERHHRIYGYLRIEEKRELGPKPSISDAPSGFARRHPHTIGEWNDNNTLYLGPGAVSCDASPLLRLTQPGGPVSIWRVPSWLRACGLTYHDDAGRWLEGDRLRAVARGQEFITDIGQRKAAMRWVNEIIAAIDGRAKRTSMTESGPVVVVMLRQPVRSNENESRADPFWEFGSFGCTGCHNNGLMHPRNASKLEGARLAFAQCGRGGWRLVHLTPPVRVTNRGSRCEAKWEPGEMPMSYANAPVLVNNFGASDFPEMLSLVEHGQRTTSVGQFASNFRNRIKPLPEEVGLQITSIYNERRATAGAAALARNYEDALPYPPNSIDRDRAGTYQALQRKISGNFI